MESRFAAFGFLKGHAIKLKLSLQGKQPKNNPPPYQPAPPQPGFSMNAPQNTYQVPPQATYVPPQTTYAPPQQYTPPPAPQYQIPTPTYPQATYPPPKPAPIVAPKDNPLAKEAEKVAAKLRDIDTLRASITQAKDLILNLDVSGYRKTLEMIAALQDSLRVAAEVQAEAATAAENGDEMEKKNDDVAMSE
jgi:hypothetical protein